MVKVTVQLKKWKNKVGKEYTDRNSISLNDLEKLYKSNFGITRTELNKLFLGRMGRAIRILEVGCNIGNQLLCLQKMGFKNLYGIEPQDYAVEISKKRTKGVNIIKGDVFDMPFKDNYFDLIFTSGVLIHISRKHITKAIKEIYRCSRKYIWGYEYYSKKRREIPFRGKRNFLWKANFIEIYTDIFPDLKLIKVKYLKYLKNDNMDTMFLFKKV
ncbi:MAG: methyltransferase type 11 [Candidatus Omnitrophica bacterium CG07_land_8_20_14_0_80_42_15]|uniref:Methyltransferase type 11 n=1 Tax=Candidatus Aquitaenariimonas noxiae TaxID=1974741 RepID=A0A2J0L5M0_9BACT|nr:MAG: methyltransferase type 11 [Candidatus Omnitrophica bacterium CG07_land_8_20_14_0_80_42_15]